MNCTLLVDVVTNERVQGAKSIGLRPDRRRDSLDGSTTDSSSDSDSDSDSDGAASDGGSDDGNKSRAPSRLGGKSVVSRASKRSSPALSSVVKKPTAGGLASVLSKPSAKGAGGLASVLSGGGKGNVASVAGATSPAPGGGASVKSGSGPGSGAASALTSATKSSKGTALTATKTYIDPKVKAEEDALNARLERWRLWLAANGSHGAGTLTAPKGGASGSVTIFAPPSGGHGGPGSAPPPRSPSPISAAAAASLQAQELDKKRTAQLTILRDFGGGPKAPAMPGECVWLATEDTWATMITNRMHVDAPVLESDVEVACMDSFGIDTYLDEVLLSPMLVPLGLAASTGGIGAVAKSFQIEPSLPRVRSAIPAYDPQPPYPYPYTHAQLIEVQSTAAKRMAARPHPVQFVEKFVPRSVWHTVYFHPYTPPKTRVKTERPLPQSILDRMRERKWKDETMAAEPPMWFLLKHPHL